MCNHAISSDPVMAKYFDGLRPNSVFMTKALTRKVLVVAVKGHIGDWAAYIDAVPGEKHEDEKYSVAETGEKLDSRLAAVLFPGLNIAKYRL